MKETLVHLNTEQDLISGNSSSGVLQLYQQIGSNHQYVTLIDFEIALGIFPIRAGCNTFVFNNYTATIDSGNYTGSTLATALQTALTAVGSGITFTVSYTSLTNKINVASSSSITIGTSVCTNSILGFTAGQSGASITATNELNINHDMYLSLFIPSFGNGFETNRPLTFKIPLQEGYGAINYYVSKSQFSQPKINMASLQNFKSLTFELRDHFGNLVDNQGLPWSAILSFE